MSEPRGEAGSSSTQKRAEALLSRYGGEKGPTGHAEACANGEPVSLASFIGGKADAPRLGHLEGDGRTAASDAALAEEKEYRQLPGLAKSDGSMAKLMEQRHRELFPEEAKQKDKAKKCAGQGTHDTNQRPHEENQQQEGQEKEEKVKPKEDASSTKFNTAPSESTSSSTADQEGSNATKTPTAPSPKRNTSGKEIVVLISGSGSNFQAILDATIGVSPEIPDAQVVRVISNRMAAYGLQRAKNVDPPIPTKVHSLKTYQNKNPGKTREDYDLVLADYVLGDGKLPDLVVLAGFMHIVSETFLSALGHPTSLATPPAFSKRPQKGVPIINLHPALPGAFDGANAIERAYDAFQKKQIQHTGVMVHEVVAEVDRGAPILVEEVPIYENDSLDDLENRMHAVEHGLIVKAAAKVLAAEPKDAPPIQQQNKTAPSTQVDPFPVVRLHGEETPQTDSNTVLAYVSSSGLLEPLNTFTPEVYESDMLVAKRGSQSFLWKGVAAPGRVPESAQSFLGGSYETTYQGAETQAFASLLQGPLVTLQGKRGTQPVASQLFVVRSSDAGLFVDELKMVSSSVCSAFSYVAHTPTRVYVWHGKGSDVVQRSRAMQFAGTRSSSVVEMDEATASRDWLLLFPGPYASGWHWRHYAELLPSQRGVHLYVSPDASTSVPFTSSALRADQVALVVTSLEIYVLIGKDIRGDRTRIQNALQRAEQLAEQVQSERGGRTAMRPATHVLVFPTLLPPDLLALSRAPWADAHLQADPDATREAPVLLNVHTLSQARAQLVQATPPRGDWSNRHYLPVGVAPPA